MSRNSLGQYEKGTTGNPLGRPRKVAHSISDETVRSDFFEDEEMLVPVIEGNKRKMIPAREAINKQLMLKAASGNIQAMREYYRMRDRYTMEYANHQLKSLQAIVEGKERVRDFPEDVTDEFKRALRLLEMKIDKNYLP